MIIQKHKGVKPKNNMVFQLTIGKNRKYIKVIISGKIFPNKYYFYVFMRI